MTLLDSSNKSSWTMELSIMWKEPTLRADVVVSKTTNVFSKSGFETTCAVIVLWIPYDYLDLV